MSTTQELTVTRLKERVSRFMGWKKPEDWPAELDIVTMANEAGEWLVGLRPWSWLEREPVDVSLTAGQSFITLPTDFARHVAIVGKAPNSYGIRKGTMGEVGDARAQIVGAPQCYVFCYGYSGPSVSGPKPDVRLFIGPTPTANASNAFVLTYGAGWKPVTSGDNHILVPSWCMPLYVRATCEYVAGHEHDLAMSLEDRLDRLIESSLYMSATDRDDTLEHDLGPMRGGVEETLARGANAGPFASPNSQSIVTGS